MPQSARRRRQPTQEEFIPPGKPTLTSYKTANQSSSTRTSIRFPLNNFKHFLTLFSKFFSSFPRGTCSLSVSRQYLALDGIYHPIGAAFPNNSTLRKRPVERRGPGRRGSHPLWCPIPGDLGRGRRRGSDLKTTIQKPKAPDFQVGLFPVHSPLLGESWLVSFPPLSDMLKFGG